jgi:hypothetical protein
VRFQGNLPNVAADPIDVPFGPNSVNIPLNDGPSALGYIFTIAQASVPSWSRRFDNYVVPLQALYSRCIYLAYIVNGFRPCPGAQWNRKEGNVPWMTNSMYFTDHDS